MKEHINVRELRPGNLVIRWGVPAKVCGTQVLDHTAEVSFWDGLSVSKFGCREIFPIPLTPEWLERMGFKRGEVYSLVLSKWASDNLSVSIEIDSFQPVVMGLDDWVEYGKPMQHVHQLQNLYFTLTGEELTIKEAV